METRNLPKIDPKSRRNFILVAKNEMGGVYGICRLLPEALDVANIHLFPARFFLISPTAHIRRTNGIVKMVAGWLQWSVEHSRELQEKKEDIFPHVK